MSEPVNLFDFERVAESRLRREVYDYYVGGAQDEVTLRENRAAYDRIAIYFRVLADVSQRSSETTVLGERVSMPVLVADDETERNNASVVAQYYQRSLAAVIADWQQAREDLLEEIAELSEADLNDPARFAWSPGITLIEHIAGSSYEHEQEHIDQIRAWMKPVTSDE
jgi:DNA integrity scanning protein DisA with diadenylate cyclase activity